MRLACDSAGAGVLQRGVRAEEVCCSGPQRYGMIVLLWASYSNPYHTSRRTSETNSKA
jgi:hypothetical protein